MDPDPGLGAILINLGILLALIITNAFFTMSEIAVITLNDNKIRKMAEEGHPKAVKVMKLTASSTNFLSTIQLGVTLTGFLTSAIAAERFGGMLAAGFQKWFNLSSSAAGLMHGVALIIITIVISYFSLVLGELAPKRMGMQKAEAIALRVAGALLGIKAFFTPFVKVLAASANFVIRLFGFDPNASEEQVTEEEIRMLVDVGEEKGVIEESQKEMINNIFEFDDIVAADVMTHRTAIAAVEISDSIPDTVKLVIEEGYSRLPVFEDDLDNIVGIIYAKDLLKFVGQALPKSGDLRDIMRPAYFVPESKTCGDLFTEMTERHIQMAIVLDEYGGTAGLCTIEDLLESIVGNMQDEYDDEPEEIEQLDEDTFTMDGATDIEKVEEELCCKLPEGEYGTLAGMILSMLGRIPKPEEHPFVEAAGYRFTVESLEERRIQRVKVERMEPPAEQPDAEEPSQA